jgi:hypothetical protein
MLKENGAASPSPVAAAAGERSSGPMHGGAAARLGTLGGGRQAGRSVRPRWGFKSGGEWRLGRVRRLFVGLVAVASRKGERLFWRVGWVGGCGNGGTVLLARYVRSFGSSLNRNVQIEPGMAGN